MPPCHGFLKYLAVAAFVCCGSCWWYLCREISRDVNKLLPANQRRDFPLSGKGPAGLLGWLWNEHAKHFPTSRKRRYAVLSILLFFLIPIGTVVTCILIG